MSGRVITTLADGRRVRGFRKTLRQNRRAPPHLMPDWRLVAILPKDIAFAVSHCDPTGVIGVTMRAPGIIEARGKDRDWVLKQVGTFLALIASGRGDRTITATLEREGVGHVSCHDFTITDSATVCVTRPLQKPLVVRVARHGR